MRKISTPCTDPTPLFRHGGVLPNHRGSLLDFSASINPLGPPESVLRVLRHELSSIAHYPDTDCRKLTKRLAALHQVSPEHVVVGNGSNELIYSIARAFRPKRVAIVEPTYTEYLRASLLIGAKVDHWLPERGFRFRPFLPGAANLVWICHPNNPTGDMWASSWQLSRWVEAHPRVLFVIDEAFLSESAQRWVPRSLIPYMERRPNLIVLRSLTKSHALPGLRLGYAVASPRLAECLRSQIVPWSVNCLAQSAGLAALEDRDYARRTAQWLGESHSMFRAGLQELAPHLKPLTSRANFFLIELKTLTSDCLTARLAERGFAIRDASNFVGLDRRYVRMAVRTPADNSRLFGAIRAIVAEAAPCPAP
jgi:threonine-phosphate decarboxylase